MALMSIEMKRNVAAEVTATKKQEKSIINGHPWVYAEEISPRGGSFPEDGSVVDVFSEKGRYLGSGFYNSASKIAVRLLARDHNISFDDDFFRRRVKYAYDYRRLVMPGEDSYRLIFGEADGLPGLTVDKFGKVLVAQTACLGTDLRKDIIFGALLDLFEKDVEKIDGIYQRDDVPVRLKEGLAQEKGWYENAPHQEETSVVISENGIKYYVDFENGQKTGFFLDQKYNRIYVRDIAKGLKVLDVCTHTGSFALNAFAGGADKIAAVDVSEKAVKDSKENFALNGAETHIEAVCADMFDYLGSVKKGQFDMIILDPPAFTKSRNKTAQALKGYSELNALAISKLKRGSLLVTASCSHFISRGMYLQCVSEAARNLNVSLKMIRYASASPDHPILIGVPETEYLEFFIFQVC